LRAKFLHWRRVDDEDEVLETTLRARCGGKGQAALLPRSKTQRFEGGELLAQPELSLPNLAPHRFKLVTTR
jgi:hypothetical protein